VEKKTSMIHLIHCKHFCKCHNVQPASTKIKKNHEMWTLWSESWTRLWEKRTRKNQHLCIEESKYECQCQEVNSHLRNIARLELSISQLHEEKRIKEHYSALLVRGLFLNSLVLEVFTEVWALIKLSI
jgi:hypothetical protein